MDPTTGLLISKIFAIEFLVAVAIFSAIILLISLHIVGNLCKKHNEPKGLKIVNILRLIVLAPLVLIILCLIDARYIEPNWIQVKPVKVKNANFTNPDYKKYKIIQISDLHIEKNGFREKQLVKKINNLRPDVVLITGDIINCKEGLAPAIEVLKKLKAKNGIFAIMGNNDYYYLEESEFISAFKNINIKILKNDAAKIISTKPELWIVGFSYKHAFHYDRITDAFRDIPKEANKIVMIHEPEAVEKPHLKDYNPQLVLAGHTHGGQVGFSFIRHYSDYAERSQYMNGMFNVNDIKLYVNKGIGVKTKNMRFFCRPEITVIKLAASTLEVGAR